MMETYFYVPDNNQHDALFAVKYTKDIANVTEVYNFLKVSLKVSLNLLIRSLCDHSGLIVTNSTLFESTQHSIFYKFIRSDQMLLLYILTQIASKSKHYKTEKTIM